MPKIAQLFEVDGKMCVVLDMPVTADGSVHILTDKEYEQVYENGESSAWADVVFAFDEVLDLDVDGAFDAAHKVKALIAEAVAAEREACAKVVENYDPDDTAVTGRYVISREIRARSNNSN
jgi:hypothetical protein